MDRILLRDWFAGMVLPQLVESYAGGASQSAPETAAKAYQFADAMLAEKERAHKQATSASNGELAT